MQSYIINGETEEEADQFLNKLVFEHKKKIVSEKLDFKARKMLLSKNVAKYTEKPMSEAPINNVNDAFKQEETNRINKELNDHIKDVNECNNDGPIVENYNTNNVPATIKSPIELQKINYSKDNKISSVISGQNYVVISFVGLTGQNNRVGFRIKGAFNTLDEATKHANECIEQNNLYDNLICEMYEWIPTDFDISKIKTVYNNEGINNIFDAKASSSNAVRQFHNEHKEHDDKIKEKIAAGIDIHTDFSLVNGKIEMNRNEEQVKSEQVKSEQINESESTSENKMDNMTPEDINNFINNMFGDKYTNQNTEAIPMDDFNNKMDDYKNERDRFDEELKYQENSQPIFDKNIKLDHKPISDIDYISERDNMDKEINHKPMSQEEFTDAINKNFKNSSLDNIFS